MKAKEMATAIQNLARDVGVSSSKMARCAEEYANEIIESYVATGASGGNSATYILKPAEELFTIDSTCYTSLAQDYYRPRRLKCVYCDCISSKESGTCEHCGAPLVEDEY